ALSAEATEKTANQQTTSNATIRRTNILLGPPFTILFPEERCCHPERREAWLLWLEEIYILKPILLIHTPADLYRAQSRGKCERSAIVRRNREHESLNAALPCPGDHHAHGFAGIALAAMLGDDRVAELDGIRRIEGEIVGTW